MIDYKYAEIKCPKCGKSHFKVRRFNTDFGYSILPTVFIDHPNPIYKDGILQNPEPIRPAIEKFQCMECGCNFRTETYPAEDDVAVVPNIINEDEEEGFFEKIIREHNEEAAKQKDKYAKEKEESKSDKEFQERTNECQQDFEGTLTYTPNPNEPSISYILDDTKITTTLYEELKDKIEDISKRLNKMEEKLNDK